VGGSGTDRREEAVSVSVVKIVYKPVGALLSAVAGLAAGAAFRRGWKAVARQEQVPKATEPDRGWGEVLAAAALQGALFALVTAAVDRGGATVARRLTGVWPT
jgi:hypothetical protein